MREGSVADMGTRQLFSNLVALGVLLAAGGVAPARAGDAAGLQSSIGSGSSWVPASDVFLGRGVVGPYILAWRNVESDSESVTRNGARLTRSLDYTFDATTGVLAFRSALTSRDIARVDYRYVPGKATATSSVLSIPFDLSLLKASRGGLGMSAVYRSDLMAQQGTSGTGLGGMQLGFDGSYRAGKTSEMSAKLALDTRFGDLSDRAGLLLKGKTSFQGGKLDLSLSRAGSGYLLADQTGIVAGKETLQGTLELTPLKSMKGTLGFNETADLPSSGVGSTVTTISQKLVGTLDKSTSLQATHTATESHTPGSDDSTRDVSRVQVTRTLDTRTSLTALFTRTETGDSSGSTLTQAQSVDLTTRPATWLTVNGRYQNRLLASGAEDSGQVKLEAQAGRRVKVNATIADRLDHLGGLHTREATVDYVPTGNLTLTSGFTLSAEGAERAASRTLGATWKPGTFEVGGSVKLREALSSGATQDAPDTYDVRVAAGLRHTPLKLTGSFAENPVDTSGTVQRIVRQGMGLKATLGRIDVTTDLLQESGLLADTVSDTRSLQLGWSFRKGTRLSGEYRESRLRDTSLDTTGTYSLALTHQVGSALDLSFSLGLTQHLKDGQLQSDSERRAETKLKLRF